MRAVQVVGRKFPVHATRLQIKGMPSTLLVAMPWGLACTKPPSLGGSSSFNPTYLVAVLKTLF